MEEAGQGTFWEKKRGGLMRCDMHQEDSGRLLSFPNSPLLSRGPTSQCRCGHLLGSFIFFLSEELQDPA